MKPTDTRLTRPGRHEGLTREQWRWLYFFGYRDNWGQVTIVSPCEFTLSILKSIKARYKNLKVVIIDEDITLS
jgi:hypothetical protein